MAISTCLNCGASEQDKPLIIFKFQGKELYICPQCLPTLIHKSYELAEKLPGFKPADHPADPND